MFFCGKTCHARFITVNILSLYGQAVVLHGVGKKSLNAKPYVVFIIHTTGY